ncbi:MAG: adenylosuccinate lyase [Candidatus Methanomethylophilaceae archaeon]|nr:adenylosuccinate lyase [Candidatus Methanomethylophilaceae archaeon]
MSNLCPLDFRYGRAEMKRVFDEDSRLLFQMQVEAALARAHAFLGNIPNEAAETISAIADLDHVKISRVKEIERDTKHDLMALVKAMTEASGDAGRYVHLGATSNDIVDTATALQIKSALGIIRADVDELILTLAKLAKRERDTLEVGRTHAQFAIPITFGFKIAGYLAEMLRHRERLEQVEKRAAVGKMAGAVGTGAALGAHFFQIQEKVMEDLGLGYEPAATQVVGRDRYTELICLLANIATSLDRYGTEVRNLQRSELSEAMEAFDVTKQVGSSTMAQKKNPITSENVCGLARIVRGFVIPTFESQVLWHERDLSNSSAERFVLPHVFVLLDDMLHKMIDVFSHLSVDRKRMIHNIEQAKGMIMAEPVMMALAAKGLGRQEAHELVREASMVAARDGLHLQDALLASPVRDILSDKEIWEAMDPAGYVGGAPEIVDRLVLEASRTLGINI